MPKWAEELVPDDLPEQAKAIKLRQDIRYWCFRLQTEAEEGVPSTGRPRGLKPHFEKQEWFDGWENFGKTWDVEADDPLTARPRWRTIHEEWEDVIQQELVANTIQTRKNQRMMANGDEGEL